MRPLAILAALLIAACRGRPSPAPRPAPSIRPNVLLITIDTLRADHLGLYGYRRHTSPHIDAFGAEGTVFERAYTYWPKTRGSMVILFTGRRPSQTGYTRTHPALLPFNPTLASVLKAAGYGTFAIVDNPNVAAANGFAKGFDRYQETWEDHGLGNEVGRAKAITKGALKIIEHPPEEQGFFLWLHYVNPHGPYTPPPPYDAAFLDDEAQSGPTLPVVPGFHGGIHKQWAAPGHDRLGYYVAQYDGEIATADAEVGQVLDALRASPSWEHTIIVVTADHGESLGDHGYYFDHGEDLFDPCLRIPLIIRVPGGPRGQRTRILASTLDVVPTILDAVKVSYPPDLAGTSLLPSLGGGAGAGRPRLFAQNDRDLSASFDTRFKIVATPGSKGMRYSLYDRAGDPEETRDLSRARADDLRVERRELELFLDHNEQEWAETRRLLKGAPGEGKMSHGACEQLKSLGYLPGDYPCP